MKQLLVLLFMLIIALTVEAATTATLQLKGTISQLLSITITPESIATALPLEVTQNGTKIATVTEQSNSLAGYSVTVTSQNLGKLVLNNNSYINYSLTYNNQSVNLATGQTFTSSFTNAAPVSKDLEISYTALVNGEAGDYTDTVTFTMAAN